MTDPDDGLSPLARWYREAAPWTSAVWQLTGSALVGVGMGLAADKYLGVEPWGLLVGAVLGCVTGFYAFILSVTRLMDSKSKKK